MIEIVLKWIPLNAYGKAKNLILEIKRSNKDEDILAEC